MTPKDTTTRRQKSFTSNSDKLINEAIKRILLDIVVRGHGDRLLGKWSREPELEHFLEQVPYMLDRINQLHLACTRGESLELDHVHHYHHAHRQHHHHNHHNHHKHQTKDEAEPNDDAAVLPLGQSSLHDFVNLIGHDRHWLVRTRDPLGLTPLHKAVLYNNRPIVEYILDRYPDELAASGGVTASSSTSTSRLRANHRQAALRLIDAQDKYGRTALHYAAALATPIRDTSHHQSHIRQADHLYQFLIIKGAANSIRDFRGKTAAYYLRHPNHLKTKSIINLANKLNANYQASVLSKTLRAALDRRPLDFQRENQGQDSFETEDDDDDDDDHGNLDFESLDGQTQGSQRKVNLKPEQNRESMSMSCGDLTSVSRHNDSKTVHTSTKQKSPPPVDDGQSNQQTAIKESAARSMVRNLNSSFMLLSDEEGDTTTTSGDDGQVKANYKITLKQLKADRVSKQVIDTKTKQMIKKSLNDGTLDRINEILIDGHGEYLMSEAPVSCWNLQCKKYVAKVVPKLLAQLDQLHEFIVTNEISSFVQLLNNEPILARIKRPYRRASLAALHLAVHFGRKSITVYLLEKFPELLIQRDSMNATCLHWAAKSLKNDSIYCWLSDNFGQQLEHLRDSRNKTAADYRQQVIRCSSYELNNLSTPLDGDHSNRNRSQRKPISVRGLMRQTQLESNKLRVEPKRATLHHRNESRGVSRSKNIDMDDEVDKKVSISSTEMETSNFLDDPSVEIGLDSGSSKSLDNLAENEAEKAASFTKIVSEDRESDDSETDLNHYEHKDRPNGSNQRRLSSSSNGDNREVFAEMLQIEEESEPSEHQPRRPPSSTQLMDRPPSSAASLKKLNSLIYDCISFEDFKKLDHLILAGCGQRVLEIYLKRVAKNPKSSLNLSEKLKQYLDQKIPAMMRTIANMHEQLHQSFAQAYQLDKSDSINQNFHKFCNLLVDQKPLIMGRDEFGASPLHVAVMRCDSRLIDHLLRRHPEAASGPDHESRNALHYAAIVLAFSNQHASKCVKLTKLHDKRPGANETSMYTDELQMPVGFWEVSQSEAKKIYDKMSDRYGDLLAIRDKHELTCQDYLTPQNPNEAHIDIESQPIGLLPAEILSGCCEGYAKLLSRYNYLIINDRELEDGQDNQPTRDKSFSEPASVYEDSRSSERSRTETAKRAKSCDDGETHEDDVMKVLDGELVIPATSVPLESAYVRQVAAKPTVGVADLGYTESPSPTTEMTSVDFDVGPSARTPLTPARSAPVGKTRQESLMRKSRGISSPNSPSLLDSMSGKTFVLGPDSVKINGAHGHHHKLRGPSKSTSGSIGPTRSVVGGVIVPTIIHNDKMDEIETYDIIYRQPQTSPKSVAIQQQNQQASSRVPSATASLMDDPMRPKRSDFLDSQLLAATLSGKSSLDDENAISESDSMSSQDRDELDENTNEEEEEDGDEDDRVERLSNEFEDRVRREKSELRAKVDQIMNEIKVNAKSTKSSRFLVSPVDGKSGEGSSTQRVNFVLQQQQPQQQTKTKIFNSIESSSGKSSATCSSSSTGSSTASSTKSLLSASRGRHVNSSSTNGSCNSSCSSSVSSLASVTSGSRLKEIQQTHQTTEQSHRTSYKLATANQPITSVSDLANQLVSKNPYGQTYLHFIASRTQCPTTLYKVLDHGSHLIGERDVFYRTARDVAVQFNLPNNVQVLDKFIIDQFIGANTSLLHHLLNQGYSPLIHVSDPDGNDIMLILKLLKLDRMIHFLLQMADFQRWRDELHTFIRHGYSAGVSELIKKHKDLVKAKSVHSRTSLHLAVLFDRLEMVNELLETDPTSVHCTDNMGRNALHYTYGLHLKNDELIRDKLLACGANLNARDVKMRTPKYYYIFKREIEEIKRMELELN